MRHIIIVSTCLTRRFCKGLQVAKGYLVLLDGITLANTVLASWLVVAIRHAYRLNRCKCYLGNMFGLCRNCPSNGTRRGRFCAIDHRLAVKFGRSPLQQKS